MFSGYVIQRMLLVGDRQCTTKDGTQQERALPTSSREKNVLSNRGIKASERVSLCRQEVALFLYALGARPVRGLIKTVTFAFYFIFHVFVFFFFFVSS